MKIIFLNFIEIYSKYLLLYSYFLLAGRSFLFIINKTIKSNKNIPNSIFGVNTIILEPILGHIFVGNLLVLLNIFLPLKSVTVNILLFLLVLPNLLKVKLKYSINFINILNYLIIPGILLISSFDINFHYDAGYYHLNTQNWLRESNIVFGFVNIFWPFGISSIYEYLSSVLWFDKSFILLHFLNLMYIHFLYQFLFSIYKSRKNLSLMNASIFIVIFSIFDNFGFNGGRNGFIYIQGVGKQDIPIAILYFFMSISILVAIKDKKFSNFELVLAPVISFYIFQLKVSGIIIFFLHIFLVIILYKNKFFNLKQILTSHIPVFIISLVWFTKNILTTGCLIFPLSVSCINLFNWYVPNSTEAFESVTKDFSQNFDSSKYSFLEWTSLILSIEINKTVIINFTVSIVLLMFLKRILFIKSSKNIVVGLISTAYLFTNFLFLIFFGPTPRYSIGIILITVSFLGLYSEKSKFKINDKIFVGLLLVSALCLVRISSYIAFINNHPLMLNDPQKDIVINNEIGFLKFNENWVYPTIGDQCWTNIKCSMAKKNINFDENKFFKVAKEG